VCAPSRITEARRHRGPDESPGWVVSPKVFNAEIILELTDNDDAPAAGRFVTKVLADMGLA
jgi:hypothetical protein